MSDADIPDWYRTYVVGAGRLLCYALGVYVLLGPLVQIAATDLAVVRPRFGAYGPPSLAASVVLGGGLFLVDRTTPGHQVFLFGFVTQLCYSALTAVLVDGGFAAGSELLWLDYGLAVLAAAALAYELVLGGLWAEAKAFVATRWR